MCAMPSSTLVHDHEVAARGTALAARAPAPLRASPRRATRATRCRRCRVAQLARDRRTAAGPARRRSFGVAPVPLPPAPPLPPAAPATAPAPLLRRSSVPGARSAGLAAPLAGCADGVAPRPRGPAVADLRAGGHDARRPLAPVRRCRRRSGRGRRPRPSSPRCPTLTVIVVVIIDVIVDRRRRVAVVPPPGRGPVGAARRCRCRFGFFRPRPPREPRRRFFVSRALARCRPRRRRWSALRRSATGRRLRTHGGRRRRRAPVRCVSSSRRSSV